MWTWAHGVALFVAVGWSLASAMVRSRRVSLLFLVLVVLGSWSFAFHRRVAVARLGDSPPPSWAAVAVSEVSPPPSCHHTWAAVVPLFTHICLRHHGRPWLVLEFRLRLQAALAVSFLLVLVVLGSWSFAFHRHQIQPIVAFWNFMGVPRMPGYCPPNMGSQDEEHAVGSYRNPPISAAVS